ncbi:hypothetical protein CL621_04385 [archaeon]|nr:hypothetical protein [archaeon]|tara:strand:+ start:995 stop:1327 length:333 start_codon:yes stop_codon:yes gene_type:complete
MNIEEIRKKKLEEFQGNMNEQQQESLNEQLQLQQQIQALEENLKQYLTREAIERYYNIKSAHPEMAIKIIVMVAQLVQAGQLNEKLSDEKFKAILQQIQEPKKEFKIKRK